MLQHPLLHNKSRSTVQEKNARIESEHMNLSTAKKPPATAITDSSQDGKTAGCGT